MYDDFVDSFKVNGLSVLTCMHAVTPNDAMRIARIGLSGGISRNSVAEASR